MKAMGFLYQMLLFATTIFHAMSNKDGTGVDSSCTNVLPSHGASSRTTAAPYTVTFSPTSFTPGQTIAGKIKTTRIISHYCSIVTLTTSSGTGFKGFMKQARRDDTNQNQELLGSFSGGSTTRQACTGKALVHSSSTTKSSLTFNWIAPSTSVGNITFRVTYVQTYDVFWANRVSSVLAEIIPTTTTSTTTTTTTTSTSTTTTRPTTPSPATTSSTTTATSTRPASAISNTTLTASIPVVTSPTNTTSNAGQLTSTISTRASSSPSSTTSTTTTQPTTTTTESTTTAQQSTSETVEIYPTLPSLETTTQSGAVASDSACGDTKGCFTSCHASRCSFVVSWQLTGAAVTYTLL